MMNGTVITAKAAAYQYVAAIDAPNDSTLIFHLKQPFAALLWNLSDGALGIVPNGTGKEFNQHPIGSGPFKFVRNEQDNEVVVMRNDDYWQARPKLASVRFAVVPDATTRALELRKGSADAEINSLSADMLSSLRRDPGLAVEQGPGTAVQYVAFNLRDPVLRDVRVRQAIAYGIDVRPVIQYLWRNTARPADSLLPPEHWAYDRNLRPYAHDRDKARQLLISAGYSLTGGSRLHLTMKTSTEETSRLLAVILQQQLREIGIDLEIRTFEFATFYSDVQRGAFQMYTLRWVGGTNQDPDVFEYIFDSKSFPPRRANRSYYSNPHVDQWIADGLEQIEPRKRKESYARIQEQLQQDVPSINLWYLDNVIVHTRRVRDIHVDSAGNFDFLRTAELQ
jgi:peptide/nickel transport system substrate-binding protein